ncbi:hypothetical protein VTK56DRAFT_193 [Thermocarpiscus australiensis]
MAAAAPERRVRISRVAGRYLVFDIEDVAYIRRHHGICAVLTGTMPQNPTQSLFLGLPIELHAEEAKLLVDKDVGYIADELSDHLSRLTAMNGTARKAYLQSLKQQRRHAQLVFDEEKAMLQAKHESKRKAAKSTAKAKEPAAEPGGGESSSVAAEGETLFDAPRPKRVAAPSSAKSVLPAITPTISGALLPPSTSSVEIEVPKSYPFFQYLNSRGYYITPGLRFGGDYSVYPGDPFRYHAHYLANSYGWDEEIPMLDLVTLGRLGTGVKKSFLFGAEKPADTSAEPRKADGVEGGEVRVFCVEWASM